MLLSFPAAACIHRTWPAVALHEGGGGGGGRGGGERLGGGGRWGEVEGGGGGVQDVFRCLVFCLCPEDSATSDGRSSVRPLPGQPIPAPQCSQEAGVTPRLSHSSVPDVWEPQGPRGSHPGAVVWKERVSGSSAS